MSEKVELYIRLEPNGDGKTHCSRKMEGSTAGLLEAYERMSKDLFTTLAESADENFAEAMYAIMQKRIIEGIPFLKKSYDEVGAEVERLKPLLNIIGKTFTVGGEE